MHTNTIKATAILTLIFFCVTQASLAGPGPQNLRNPQGVVDGKVSDIAKALGDDLAPIRGAESKVTVEPPAGGTATRTAGTEAAGAGEAQAKMLVLFIGDARQEFAFKRFLEGCAKRVRLTPSFVVKMVQLKEPTVDQMRDYDLIIKEVDDSSYQRIEIVGGSAAVTREYIYFLIDNEIEEEMQAWMREKAKQVAVSRAAGARTTAGSSFEEGSMTRAEQEELEAIARDAWSGHADGGAAAVAGAASTGISFSALKAALVGYCYRFRTNTYNGQYVQTVEVIDGQKSKFFNLPVPAVHAEVAPGYQQILSSFFEGLFQRLFGEELERVTFTWKENKNAIVVTVIRSAAVATGTVAAGTGEAATNGADAAPVAGFTVLGVTDNIESTGRKMQELTQSVAEENNLGKVNVQLFNILAVPAAENIITAITDKAEEIRAERVFLWLDNDTADIAGAIKYLRETGNLEIEVVVLSGNDDAAARKAIKESL